MNIKSSKSEFLSQKNDIIKEIESKLDKIASLPSLSIDTLSRDNTLVINVDINNGFGVAGSLYSPRTGDLISPTVEVLRAFRERGFEVLAYSDRHTKDSPELETFPEHCLDETEEYKLPTQIKEQCSKVVYKNSTNAFLSRSPFEIFPDKTDIIITGCLTDICIFQIATSMRAYLNQNNMRGYNIIVVADLIDTFDAPGHNALLYNIMYISGLMENGIKVVSSIEK